MFVFLTMVQNLDINGLKVLEKKIIDDRGSVNNSCGSSRSYEAMKIPKQGAGGKACCFYSSNTVRASLINPTIAIQYMQGIAIVYVCKERTCMSGLSKGFYGFISSFYDKVKYYQQYTTNCTHLESHICFCCFPNFNYLFTSDRGVRFQRSDNDRVSILEFLLVWVGWWWIPSKQSTPTETSNCQGHRQFVYKLCIDARLKSFVGRGLEDILFHHVLWFCHSFYHLRFGRMMHC